MSVRVCYAQLLVFILFLYSPLGELNSELTLDVFVFFPRLCLCERVSLTCTAVTSVNSTLKKRNYAAAFRRESFEILRRVLGRRPVGWGFYVPGARQKQRNTV